MHNLCSTRSKNDLGEIALHSNLFLSVPRALVIVIHGLAEHLAVYDELAQRLTAENMLAFGHDHRKLGKVSELKVHPLLIAPVLFFALQLDMV